jgi:uncharacterized membrane protein
MSVDPTMMFVLKFLGVLYALVVVSVVSVIVVALFRIPRGHSDSVRDLFRLTRFLELTTVLVIIISATFLGALGLLKSEGVAAILGGIAGYVLGGRVSQQEAPPKPTASPQASAVSKP